MFDSNTTTQDDASDVFPPEYPGFGRRLLAYLFDVLPITLLTGLVYLSTANVKVANRADFLEHRNFVRDLSFAIYVVYCAIMEGSTLQGTLGKRMLGLRVTDLQRRPLSMARSIGRNFAKIVSLLPLGLGFLWALWSKDRQGWHDMIAGTLVVKSASSDD